jgi:two-component system, NtrC family, nitrogen regulation response regulator GlnG
MTRHDLGDGGTAAQARPPEHAVADAVPAIVDALLATRTAALHHDAMVLLERPLLAHVLSLTGGNQLRAARLLGLNRNTLRKRCRALRIAEPRGPRYRRPVETAHPPAP